MAKYYVYSGPLSVVINANSHEEAACKALQTFTKQKKLGNEVLVNEHGSEETRKNGDTVFRTKDIMEKIRDDYTSK